MRNRRAPATPLDFDVVVASSIHGNHAESIAAAIRREVDQGSEGMALRPAELIRAKMDSGDAVLALARDDWIGFCYLQPWEDGRFVSSSGFLVRSSCRGRGVGKRLKEAVLALGISRYPGSQFFGLSTSETVWRINKALGFLEVPYSRITRDPEFWSACRSCPFYEDLRASDGETCRCTAMLLRPEA